MLFRLGPRLTAPGFLPTRNKSVCAVRPTARRAIECSRSRVQATRASHPHRPAQSCAPGRVSGIKNHAHLLRNLAHNIPIRVNALVRCSTISIANSFSTHSIRRSMLMAKNEPVRLTLFCSKVVVDFVSTTRTPLRFCCVRAVFQRALLRDIRAANGRNRAT